MKARLLVVLAVTSLLLSGCVVLSVYPFYTAKDVVFEPALVGTWSEHGPHEDADEFWRFERSGEKTYRLTQVHSKGTNGYEALLFRLKGQTFLDFCPTNFMPEQLPLHYLAKITQVEPTLRYQVLDYKWLGNLVKEKPKTIRHIFIAESPDDTNKNQLVLTASTRELQAFLLKHSRNEDAFTEIEEMQRWPK